MPKKYIPKYLFTVYLWNQAVFTPLQAGLNSDPKNTTYSHFMSVTNTNHWQLITQNNI